MFQSVRMSVGESPRIVELTTAKSMNMSPQYPSPSGPNTTRAVLHKSHSSPGRFTNFTNGICEAGMNPNNQGMPEGREPGESTSSDTKLRSFPLHYPLERTATTIYTESLQDLIENISTFMKDRSIACSYNDQTGRFDGLTMNLLRFSVQLWGTGRPPAKNGLLPVLVEIQRRQGCCIEMQRLRQELIQHLTRSVHHRDSDSNIHVNSSQLCDKSLNEELLQTWMTEQYANRPTSTLPSVVPAESSIDDSFRIGLSLLKSSMLDQNRLGLESLCMISDVSKSSIEQAQYASSKILANGELQQLLLPYFVRVEISPRHQSTHPMESGRDDDHGYGARTLDYAQGSYFGGMHILALKVVSHALETKVLVERKTAAGLPSNGIDVESTSITLFTPFWNHALQAMIYNTHFSHLRPLEAALSIRCLRLLNALVPEAWNRHGSINPIGHRPFDDMLLDARSYGRRYHLGLEQETQALLTQLGVAC